MKNFGIFSQLTSVNGALSKRSSSWDKTGGNEDWVVIGRDGGRQVLLEEAGAGCLNHFYWTFVQEDFIGNESSIAIRNNIFRGLVLKAYWNGEKSPAIEAPLGDFFGVSNGYFRPIRSLAFTANMGAGGSDAHTTWGFNCYLPMPFLSGAHIEIENQGAYDARIWFHLDYELYDDHRFIPENTGCLHAQWNRELTQVDEAAKGINKTGDENYVILNAQGEGTLAGYFMTVVNKQATWWGEGDDMIFIDGESFPPSLHGTGTEEIFGGGACPDREYTGPYTGFHCIENRSNCRWYGTNGMYRFFINDPVRFRKSLRVTIEHGHANDLANEYVSTAFWYQRGESALVKPLPPLEQRLINRV